MKYLLLLLVSLSHILAARGFWRAIAARQIPTMVDFGCVSIFLYYDLGIWLQFSGIDPEDRHLVSLASVSDVNFGITIAILIFMPWLFHLGSLLANGGEAGQPIEQLSGSLGGRQALFFYAAALAVTVPLAVAGILRILEGLPIWEARMKVGNEWGELIILLYLPIHILGFYVCQANSFSRSGIFFVFWLLVSSILSTLSIGERSNFLLPLVICILFWARPPLKALLFGSVIFIIGASITLPMFKQRYAGADTSVLDLIILTVHNDLSRSGTLATAVELSVPAGTEVLPYPMAGYVYSALFFVPRHVASFKGQPTTSYFTGRVARSDPDGIDWGLGIGVAEELLLNGGLILVAPGFLIYGLLMGLMDRYSRVVLPLVVPSRMSGFFLCSYNLPSLLLIFGTMAGTIWVLHRLFAERLSPEDHEVAVASPAWE